ncbi:unnamed protein product [Aphanomyces euteiches]
MKRVSILNETKLTSVVLSLSLPFVLTDLIDSRAEKMTRSALKSRVQLHLSANCVVILDSLNYIKGYRYELFCLAKENSTTHCVVFVNTPVDIAQTRNVSRDSDAFPELMYSLSIAGVDIYL